MPAETCSRRLNELEAQLRDLRSREAELEVVAAGRPQFEVTDADLDQVARDIEQVIETGSDARQKALLQTIIHEIETDGIRAWPKYRNPHARGSYCGNFGGPRWTRTTYLRVGKT